MEFGEELSGKEELKIENQHVPIRIINERRRNSRISIVKSGIIIRIPTYLSAKERELQISKFLNWAEKKIRSRPELTQQEKNRNYHNGDLLKIGSHQFGIEKTFIPGKRSSVKSANQVIQLKIGSDLSSAEQKVHASNLVVKCLSAYWKPIVIERILFLNIKYFKQPLNNIRIKNNSTNWGSCSQKGNINISVRLMWAPNEVVDYVLIHELAHTIVPNHSKRFWKTVEKAMPNYEVHEAWLKQNGKYCYF